MADIGKVRIGVLFGGPSAEHDVSCASALAMIRALTGDRYDPIPIGITRDRELRRIPQPVVAQLLSRREGVRPIEDRIAVAGTPVELRASTPGHAVVTRAGSPEDVLAELDVIFPLLHGPYGEDGQVQGVLETLGVPYVGCGVLASAVGMDKVAMKRAFVAEGIPITPHVKFNEMEWRSSSDPGLLVNGLRRPLFVKPAGLGSSIGISRVTDDDDLSQAVTHALRYDSSVIVEQGVIGRELECAVLGGFSPEASVVGEVTVSGGWFDYEQKYFADEDPMIVPAAVPEHVAQQVRDLSVRAFLAAGCWGLARVDFLYDDIDDAVYVNEINTMPGFTEYSMYPKVWAAAGMSYVDLVDRLVDLAFERHALRGRRSLTAVPG